MDGPSGLLPTLVDRLLRRWRRCGRAVRGVSLLLVEQEVDPEEGPSSEGPGDPSSALREPLLP